MSLRPPEKAQSGYTHAGENLKRRETSGVYYVFTKRGGKEIHRSFKTTDKATARRNLKDFTQGEFTVPGGETGTKNHETRTVPLSDALRALLERLPRKRVSVSHGDRIRPTASARKCLETACRKLAVPPVHPHALRHYFATCAIESRVDISC